MEDVVRGAKPLNPPVGMYELKLDDRSRLKLPAAWFAFFNELKETTLFVTSLDGRTARIYPMSEWMANLEYLDSVENEDEQEWAERQIFIANDNGATVDMDSQGRITFPEKLRKLLQMDGQGLHLYAYRRHAEVLTDAIYQAQKEAVAPVMQETARRMNKKLR